MKINQLLIIAIVILASCSGGDDKSDAYGNFEAVETIVSSEIGGKLLQLNTDRGDKLLSGQLIAIADTSQLSLQLEQLEAQKAAVASKKTNVSAQIDVLKEQLVTLGTTKERTEKMFADHAATQQQLDEITGQYNVLERQVASLRTQFTMIDKELATILAQKNILLDKLSKCYITNPVTGTVIEKYVETGELLTPGKAIVKIANLESLDLRVYVSGKQLPNVKIGQTVEVMIDSNDNENQKLSGIVSWISSESEFTPRIIQTKEERVKLVYAVKIKVDNDGRLKIGMPGEVNFQQSL